MALSEFWKTLILATVPAVVGGGVIVGGIEYFSKNRELDIKMVEVGIGILRVKPEESEQISPARDWAIRVVELNSGVEFSEEDKLRLLRTPIRSLSAEAGDCASVLGSQFSEEIVLACGLTQEQFEQRLKERTAELGEVNKGLRESNRELREAMSQLINSHKSLVNSFKKLSEK